jgi:molecular chaperone DnaK (HSP70)
LLEKEDKNSERYALLVNSPGSLRRASRDLKEQLGGSLSTSTKIRFSTGQVLELELTDDDLRVAFEPQFQEAMKLVLKVLRIAKTTDWRSDATTLSEFFSYRDSDLFPQVTNLLLVGGMSRLPLLRKLW